VQQIANLLLEESAIKTAVLTAKQAIYTTVVGTSTGALKVFRIALATTGVGALVIGLVALIENFDKVKKALSNAIPGFETFANGVGFVIDKTKELLGLSEQQSAPSALDKYIKAEQTRVDASVKSTERRIALAKAEGKDTFQLEIEKEKIFLDFAQRKLDALNKNEAALRVAQVDTAKLEKDLLDEVQERRTNIDVLRIESANAANEAAKKQAAIQKEQFAKLLQETAELQLAFDKQLAEQRKANEAKFQVTLTDLADTSLETQLDDRLNFLKRLEFEEGSNLDRRINIIELEGKKRIAAAEGNANLIKLIEAETQQAIREEQKKTRDQQIQNTLDIAEETANLLSGLIQISKEQSQARIEQINQQTEVELQAINQTTQSEVDKQRQREAAQLRASRRIAAEKLKQAKLDRAAALFEIGINTAIAVSKSIAASPTTFGLPFSAFAVAQGLIQAGIVLSKPLPKYKRGGMVGGQSHEAGGTLIEAERGEFVVNRNSVSRHRSELDALNTSSAAFKRLIDERYVRPALNYYMGKKERAINVNASLNSKGMEREIKGMRRDLKRNNTVININGNDSRYAWLQN
jgi:hypothetical protein